MQSGAKLLKKKTVKAFLMLKNAKREGEGGIMLSFR